jgi:HAD superfamily hydrolase (TIGR01459 family)
MSDRSFWGKLSPNYRVILCDVWGVIHDGKRPYPGAVDRLRQWRGEGRTVVLITNAPRAAEAVERYLDKVGVPRDSWDCIASSGEAGIAALKALGRAVGFLGTPGDRVILEEQGVSIDDTGEFADLACTGFDIARPDVRDYRAELERWAERDVCFHCLNPDRVVVYGDRMVPCAGAIADEYVALGGRVAWYGKPYRTIYDYALDHAGHPPREAVLAVGDGLQTDMLGAAWMGFDAVFVTGGIHSGEPFPANFAASHGLGDWRPLATVDSLG